MTNDTHRQMPMPKPQVGNETSEEVKERLNPTQSPDSKIPMPDDKAHMGAKEEDVKQTRPPTTELARVVDTALSQPDNDDDDTIDPADVLTTPG